MTTLAEQFRKSDRDPVSDRDSELERDPEQEQDREVSDTISGLEAAAMRLPEEQRRPYQQRLSDINKFYREGKQSLGWQQSATTAIQALTRMAAAHHGLATGRNLSGLRFSTPDYEKQMDRLMAEWRTELGQLDRDEARADRKAELEAARATRESEREQDREFRTTEREAGEEFRKGEGKKDRQLRRDLARISASRGTDGAKRDQGAIQVVGKRIAAVEAQEKSIDTALKAIEKQGGRFSGNLSPKDFEAITRPLQKSGVLSREDISEATLRAKKEATATGLDEESLISDLRKRLGELSERKRKLRRTWEDLQLGLRGGVGADSGDRETFTAPAFVIMEDPDGRRFRIPKKNMEKAKAKKLRIVSEKDRGQ